MTQAQERDLRGKIVAMLSSKYGGEVRSMVADVVLAVDVREFAFYLGPIPIPSRSAP